MEHILAIAVLWLGLAVISAVAAYHVKVPIALVEICVRVIAAAGAGCLGMPDELGSSTDRLPAGLPSEADGLDDEG